jgi:hypothetical protein
MCSITKNLEIVNANRAAYEQLAHFHYRGSCPAVYTAIYAMYNMGGMVRRERSDRGHVDTPVGVIVYTMPAMELEARNNAIGEMFANCKNRTERMKMINENIRCISRVIIEPRYRGLGLAARLVRQTMPLMQAPIVEALAAMGQCNPFFEKAGMTAYPAKLSRQCRKFRNALNTVGIRDYEFLRPVEVQAKLDALDGRLKFWLEHQTQRFLNAYGKRRYMPHGLDRTRFILSKLTAEPVYYLWRRDALAVGRKHCIISSYEKEKHPQ